MDPINNNINRASSQSPKVSPPLQTGLLRSIINAIVSLVRRLFETIMALFARIAGTRPSPSEVPQFKAAAPSDPKNGADQPGKKVNSAGDRIAIDQIRSYTGDLKPAEKAEMSAKHLDDRTLAIAFKQHPEINLTIRLQDLFKSGAQVIVNAANTHLGGGSGIDGEIHKEGGNGYKDAHRQLKDQYHGTFKEGYAAMIGSGALKANYEIENVIVVAGPSQGSISDKETQLYSCYYNALALAASESKISIAFPAIGTGIFGFDAKRAAAISLKAVRDFVESHPNTCLKTISIHFLPSQGVKMLGDYEQSVL